MAGFPLPKHPRSRAHPYTNDTREQANGPESPVRFREEDDQHDADGRDAPVPVRLRGEYDAGQRFEQRIG